MFLENLSIRRSFVFSFEAALFGVASYALSDIGIRAASGMPTKVSFGMVVFQLFIESCLAIINLTPAAIIRGAVIRRPSEGSAAVMLSLCHYAPIYLLAVQPYRIFTGALPIRSPWVIASFATDLGWAFLSCAGGWSLITMPAASRNPMDDMMAQLTDSDKCMTSLGDFMAFLTSQLGERREMPKLWTPVYNYLKDLPKIQKLVRANGLRHDEIALNAVGNIAFRLLASGELHASYGVLSPDGEYVRKVWWVTANELVRRSYSRPEDVKQGLAALDMAIISAGEVK
ncbi:MAG: hypothetical protein LBQ36_08410 [Synergistaceae bacterium]|nr:hypothetical protein [Synergistaceae bacterium]